MATRNPDGQMLTYKGRSFGVNVNFTDATGAVIDITGWKVCLTLKAKISTADASADATTDVTTHTDPTNGKTVVSLTPAQTASLVGEYNYDITFKKPDGTIKTVLKDVVIFEQPVRQSVS